MVFAQFIDENIEAILQGWEDFARSLTSGEQLDVVALRDHAQKVLSTIAEDMRTSQTGAQQQAKSQGRASRLSSDTPAERHGAERALQGFDINEMFLEFRALRATVIRQWSESPSSSRPESLKELTRFNEAMDQALGESIQRFTQSLDHTRELFLGVLGHDLRTPVGSMVASAEYLLGSERLSSNGTKAVSRILRSGSRAQRMIADVVDMARHRLEGKLPLEPVQLDAGLLCQRVVDESEGYHSGRELRYVTVGNLSATWDQGRIAQLVSNLVENAIRHGSQDAPVTVSAVDGQESIVLTVHNRGPVIPSSKFREIFDPFARGLHQPGTPRPDSIGLGLYIVQAIAQAHGGEVSVSSEQAAGTTFTVRLPRLTKT